MDVYSSLTDTSTPEGYYAAAWVAKVERIGALNFPEEARRRTRFALLSGLQAEGYFPDSAELNTCAIATLSSDEATYGRSFTYSAMLPVSPGRRPRTRPIGSTSKASTAVQRSGVATG
mgnify:CR=1 FL=1